MLKMTIYDVHVYVLFSIEYCFLFNIVGGDYVKMDDYGFNIYCISIFCVYTGTIQWWDWIKKSYQ